ncbi:MAG: tryptophan-rich sensory protein [Candidatus Aminicenantes bacterium]|nr:tryptophan-rich sensory protein [Candidatus Aminicenantes bacterium]
MQKRVIFKLIVSLIICQLAGFVGSLFTTPSIPTWYASLAKPSFTPPNWVFSPVWISLFVLMGISLFLLWEKTLHFPGVKTAIFWFAVQLGLNMLWSILFFGLKSPFLALIEIIVLWIAIFLTILKSLRVLKLAGVLLIPYLIWVSFAAGLNYSIWTLNA